MKKLLLILIPVFLAANLAHAMEMEQMLDLPEIGAAVLPVHDHSNNDDSGVVDEHFANLPVPLPVDQAQETTDKIKSLLEQNGDVNTKDENGTTILMQAAQLGMVEFCQELLKRGAEVNAVNEWNETALALAVEAKRWGVVSLLVEAGGTIPEHPELERLVKLNCALFDAVGADSFEGVIVLLAKGADANVVGNEKGSTALMVASSIYNASGRLNKKSIRIMEMLIKHGARLDAQDTDGWTALMHAADCRNRKDHVRVLLVAGADVDVQGKYRTALSVAARGNKAAFKLLRKHGAKNYGSDGSRDLFNFIDKKDVIELLIASGIDVNKEFTFEGIEKWKETTPLLKAIASNEFDSTKVCEMLIKAGADVNKGNSSYPSPLRLALKRRCPAECHMLIEAGAQVSDDMIGGLLLLAVTSKTHPSNHGGYEINIPLFFIRVARKNVALSKKWVTEFMQKGNKKSFIEAWPDAAAALRIVAREGNVELCTMFLEAGTNEKALDDALSIATKEVQEKTSKILKDASPYWWQREAVIGPVFVLGVMGGGLALAFGGLIGLGELSHFLQRK